MNKKTSYSLLISAIFLVFWAFPVQAQDVGMSIDSFHADLTVNEDGTLDVVETIAVTFKEERHGIIRDIPIQYRSDENNDVRFTVELASVTDDRGNSIPYVASDDYTDLSIRIGDADIVVFGPVTYIITYKAYGTFFFFDDHDELYWNVTGTELDADISSSSATVKLPTGAEATGLSCYTGIFGLTESDCEISESAQLIDFSAEGNLTVAVGFTPDVITQIEPEYVDYTATDPYESYYDDWRESFERQRRIATWIYRLLPLVVLAGLLILRKRKGNKGKIRRPIIAIYEPPEDLKPMEVSALLHGKISGRDFASAIVDLAVRGYIKITENKPKGWRYKTTYEVEKVKEADDKLNEWEKDLFGAMFYSTEKTITSDRLRTRLGYARNRIASKIIRDLITKEYFHKRPSLVRETFGLLGFLFGFFGAIPMIYLAGEYSRSLMPIYSFVFSTALFFIVPIGLVPRSKKGVAVMDEILGFKLFLKKAERYRIKWQEQENIFERYLPFAMVFGVADKWSHVFQVWLQETGHTYKNPAWYSGKGISTLNAEVLASHLGSFSASAASSIGSSSGSSSSGSYKPYQYRSNRSSYSRPSSGSYSSGSSASRGGGSSGGGHGGGKTKSW
ncbi:MAG: DUF2207 domain-containing protein [Patescibacteria group bacterium]